MGTLPAEAKRFALYARTSTEDQQSPEDSLGWQRARAEGLVAGHGQIVCVYHDVGQSRSLPWKRRPEATALLAEVAKKATRRFDAIVVAEPHRAFAGAEFAMVFPILTYQDVELWVPEIGGRVDPDSEGHDMLMGFFGTMSKGERTRIKIRTKTAMTRLATEGRFTGGAPAYGYELIDLGEHPNKAKARDGKRLKGFAPDPYAAVIVAEMFERYAAGDGLGQIATDLTERGVLSPSAYRPEVFKHRAGSHGAWSRSAVRAILRNPVYLGRAVYGRTRRAEVLVDETDGSWGHRTAQRHNAPEDWHWAEEQTHEPIVDAAVFEAVQARFAARKGGKGPRALAKGRKPYALRGLIFCVACQEALGRPRRLYHCTVHGYRYAVCRLSTNEYARNPDLESTHPRCAYLREDKVIRVIDDFINRSFDPENAERTARDLAAAAADDAEVARLEARAEQWRRKLRDAEKRVQGLLEIQTSPDASPETKATIITALNEATADRKAAQAELDLLGRNTAPSAAELLAAIEELRDDLAALAAADDPAEKAASYRKLGVRVEWAPGSPEVTVQIGPASGADGAVAYSVGGGGGI